jgi:hypothetical protein
MIFVYSVMCYFYVVALTLLIEGVSPTQLIKKRCLTHRHYAETCDYIQLIFFKFCTGVNLSVPVCA